MKRFLKLFIVVAMISFTQEIIAQQSVTDATKAATKLNKKINKKWFKKLNQSYPLALKDISKIENEASTSEFGYDKVADKVSGWIKLNSSIKKLGSEVTYKDATIKLEYKNYEALRDESRIKAAKAHYDASTKIVSETKDYDKREVALEHLTKCFKYDHNKTYSDKIKEQQAKIYYEEGSRILTTSKTFAEKEKSISFFNKATQKIKDYKDTEELIAKLYFDEAVKLSESGNFDELYAANKYFVKADKAVGNYKDCNGLRNELHKNIAEKKYQEGVKTSSEVSFEAQKTASESFKECQKWVEGYKDAKQKEEITLEHSILKVLFVNGDGSLDAMNRDIGSPMLYGKLNRYIKTPNETVELKGVDMTVAANYLKAKEILGYNFIVTKIGKASTQYSTTGPTSTKKDVGTYYQTKEGKTKKITKTEYNISKKMLSSSGTDAGYTLKKYEGVVTSSTTSSKIKATFPIEIWDVRDVSKPILLSSFNYNKDFTSKITKEMYSGDAKAKPSSLKSGEGGVLSEQELIKKADNKNIKINYVISRNKTEISKLLNDIKYRQY